MRAVSALGGLGLCLFGVACAGSSPSEDEAAAVEAGEVAVTAPEPMPQPASPRERRVGDKVPLGGGSIAVLSTEPDVNAGRLFSPDRGQQYYAVEVEGCAGENEKDLSFEPEYFLLRTDSGVVSLPSMGIKKPDLRGGALPEGDCLSGWITYQIPVKAKVTGVAYHGSTVLEWTIPPGTD